MGGLVGVMMLRCREALEIEVTRGGIVGDLEEMMASTRKGRNGEIAS